MLPAHDAASKVYDTVRLVGRHVLERDLWNALLYERHWQEVELHWHVPPPFSTGSNGADPFSRGGQVSQIVRTGRVRQSWRTAKGHARYLSRRSLASTRQTPSPPSLTHASARPRSHGIGSTGPVTEGERQSAAKIGPRRRGVRRLPATCSGGATDPRHLDARRPVQSWHPSCVCGALRSTDVPPVRELKRTAPSGTSAPCSCAYWGLPGWVTDEEAAAALSGGATRGEKKRFSVIPKSNAAEASTKIRPGVIVGLVVGCADEAV